MNIPNRDWLTMPGVRRAVGGLSILDGSNGMTHRGLLACNCM